MTERKRTKDEMRKHIEMLGHCMDVQADMKEAHVKGLIIPKEWADVSGIPPMPGKDRITIRLDKDVVKWFKHLGPGYQRRMNVVLRIYMLSTLSKELEGAFDRDWKGDPI